MKCTPIEHQDTGPLTEALAAVKKAADYCDLSIKEKEQRMILLDLNQRIKGVDDLVQVRHGNGVMLFWIFYATILYTPLPLYLRIKHF